MSADPCADWLDAISAYMDGQLPPDEEHAVHAHLRQCTACAETLVDLVPVVQALRALPPHRPARDLWPQIGAELRQQPAFFRRRAWRHWPPLALGWAAAALVAMLGSSAAFVGYQQASSVPAADVDTYWHQHELISHDEGVPGLYAPELSAVEASYKLEE